MNKIQCMRLLDLVKTYHHILVHARYKMVGGAVSVTIVKTTGVSTYTITVEGDIR
jgi:hypothetical protein